MSIKSKKKQPEIKPDPQNVREHTERNRKAIAESLRELGAGRSIIIDADNVVIGGNGVYGEAQALGIPVRVIESTGKELIAIRRSDLHTGDQKRKALAIADNRATDLSFFDDERLLKMLDECKEFQFSAGFSEEELKELQKLGSVIDDLEENTFANNIKAMSDVFSITFLFPKTFGAAVTDYIKEHGKDKLSAHIIDFCRKAV